MSLGVLLYLFGGRALGNALLNLGVTEPTKRALHEMGVDLVIDYALTPPEDS